MIGRSYTKAANSPTYPATQGPDSFTYDRASRTFEFPANDYFPGGRVDAYEVYRGWLY